MKMNQTFSIEQKALFQQVFEGEFDAEGVYVYQAYSHAIADFAIEHQQFGGEFFYPSRMVK
jgi:hypothetical protein